MAKIDQFINGEVGLSVRTKVNKALQSVAFSEMETGAWINDDTMATATATTFATSASIAAYVTASLASINVTLLTSASSPYTVLGTEALLSVDASGGNIAINFPTAVGFAGYQRIHRTDNSANTVTVTPNGAETISDQASVSLGYQDAIQVYSDNTNLQYI